MPPVQQYVLNTPLTVAANLRYIDSNGIVVDRLFPNDYTELIGGNLSTLMGTYQSVNTILGQYNTRITTLEAEVDAIQLSGVTYMLYVNGGCLNGNASTAITTQVTSLTESECAYITALGSTTELSTAVAAQEVGLSAESAFSQNTAMSALSGWITDYETIADAVNNLWITAQDNKAGIVKALTAVTPTCAQVIVDYQAISNSALTFLLYFSGYSFIPSAYSDNGSTVRITDSYGNVYNNTLNVVTASATGASPITLATSGSTLSPTATSYRIAVTSKVTAPTLNNSCEKVVIHDVLNSSGTTASSTQCCPDRGSFSTVLTGVATSVEIVSGLSYIPQHVSITPLNSFTGGLLGDLNYSYYMTYIAGAAYINFLAPPTGTFSISYTSYR